DIAIGQAKCLDDPVMREVLVAIADWKMDKKIYFEEVEKMKGWSRLTEQSRTLVKAGYLYYQEGRFPSSDLVSLTPPNLISPLSKKGAGQ
ncbi:MAG: DUF3274 domain-containing protein, partial [Pseudomonadales bacterium]|nr:DUF3274 domain-containing protein [Pseudomonadales bacterium]